MLRPKINIQRRISPDSKITSAFFASFVIALVSAIFILFSFNFYSFPAGAEKTKGTASKGETESNLEATQELSPVQPTLTPSPTPSPIPTVTLTLTPIPTPTFIPESTPTAIPQVSQPSDSNDDSALPQLGGYSGPALEPASEKKDLLVLSDSLPENWLVEESEGVDFVSGKMGQALFLSPGKLVLSGGETFAHAGTLSFWLKLETETTNGESPLIDWNFEGEDYNPSLFEISVVSDRLYFSVYDEDGNQDDISAQLELPLEWHFVEAAWDLTKEPFKRILFIDGKKAAFGRFPFAPTTQNPSIFQIGGTLGARNPASFTIDEMVLLNWAKSESEISQ